jgi:hypothetical protein
MYSLLAHPLVVLLVGAAVTGFLIPTLTRRSQDRQKELELKTELVSELSESIMEMVMAVQFCHLARTSREEVDNEKLITELNQDYRKWEVRSAVIGTKLQSYFPATTIPTEWTQFSETVGQFYALEGASDEHKQTLALNIREKLVGWLGPESVASEDWGALRGGILDKKAELIRKVIDAPLSMFGSFRSFGSRR